MSKQKLAEIAELFGKEFRKAKELPPRELVDAVLQSFPDCEAEFLQLAIEEGSRKRPRRDIEQMLYLFLEMALEQLRFRIDARQGEAKARFEELRSLIAGAASENRLDPGSFVTIAGCVARARLDLGEELRGLAMFDPDSDIGLLKESARPRKARARDGGDPGDPAEFLALMAAAAEAVDGDPFLLAAQFGEMAAGLPIEPRAHFCATFAAADHKALNEAAVGFLLDPSEAVFRTVADALNAPQTIKRLSPAAVNRIVLLRNWLPQGRQAIVDPLIRALRVAAASAPLPSAQRQPAECYMSIPDGAGAQSILALLKDGKNSMSLQSW